MSRYKILDLIDYSDAAKSLKKLDDFFEDVNALKDQESVKNNDDFDKDNLPNQISIPFVDTTTDLNRIMIVLSRVNLSLNSRVLGLTIQHPQ